MEWIDRFSSAMDYIEENLVGDIDWEQAARLALCSTHQFARTFSLVLDVSLSEYVRLRRLTLAAQDLQQHGDKVIDVALRYGYASPTAFQRAFTLFHGVTPSQAGKPGVCLKTYPRIYFQMTIQGGTIMEYRLEKKPAFRLVGIAETVSMVNGENFDRIPKMWNSFYESNRTDALNAYRDGRYDGLFGMMDMCEKNPEEMFYMIAVSSTREDLADGFEARQAPEAEYAVFETPLSKIQETTKRIYSEWLPNSGYEHAPAPEFEFYPDDCPGSADTYICEIWLPVMKRKAD